MKIAINVMKCFRCGNGGGTLRGLGDGKFSKKTAKAKASNYYHYPDCPNRKISGKIYLK